MPSRPSSSWKCTISRIARSSIQRSCSLEMEPLRNCSRASSRERGRRKLPTWSARKGGRVRSMAVRSSVRSGKLHVQSLAAEANDPIVSAKTPAGSTGLRVSAQPDLLLSFQAMPAIHTGGRLSHPEVSFPALPPLSLYVHIPWCVRKCPYCDFNSHELRTPTADAAQARSLDPDLESQYGEALMRDLEAALPQIWGRRVSSVFFGGGTS